MKNRYTLSLLAVLLLIGNQLRAQAIRSGKETINKMLLSGLVLDQKIPEKELAKSWQTYLAKHGSVKSSKGVYTIENATIKSISSNKLQITSKVSSASKNQQQIFVAFNTGAAYISGPADDGYSGAEAFLKDFDAYAGPVENARVAEVALVASQKENKKLLSKNESLLKDIDKSEKNLTGYRSDLEKSKVDQQVASDNMKTKQNDFDKVKTSGTKEIADAGEKAYNASKKDYKKQEGKTSSLEKSIDKTEKKLTKLRSDLDKNKGQVQTAQVDLDSKQKAFNEAKTKIK